MPIPANLHMSEAQKLDLIEGLMLRPESIENYRMIVEMYRSIIENRDPIVDMETEMSE